MHAYFITGGDKAARAEKIRELISIWKTAPVDVVYLDPPAGESIKIDGIRGFNRRLLLKPFQSAYTAGVITKAELMTTEAQNALLKVLEEPPAHVRIVLEAPSKESLLPTILSRCELVALGGSESANEEIKTTLGTLLSADAAQVMTLIDALAPDRESAKAAIDGMITAAHKMLLEACTGNGSVPSRENSISLIRKLMDAKRRLLVNCNPKLSLDRVFL